MTRLRRPSETKAAIAAKRPIRPPESFKHLLGGNKRFVAQVAEAGVSLKALAKQNFDEVWVVCADARSGTFMSFETQSKRKIGVVFVAGNAISDSENHPASRMIISSAISRLNKGGTIRLIGHICCGAVHVAAPKDDRDANMAHPEELRGLVGQVDGTGELRNLAEQRTKLMEVHSSSIDSRDAIIVAHLFDWNDHKNPISMGIRLYGSTTVQDPSVLEAAVIFRTRSEAGLVTDLDPQYAHAVVVTSVGDSEAIPHDLRTVFGVDGPNEIFTVTANATNLEVDGPQRCPAFDALPNGSALYAALTAGANAVALVHTNLSVLRVWRDELDSWFNGLAGSSTPAVAEIGRRYQAGEIGVATMQFDDATGQVSNVALS